MVSNAVRVVAMVFSAHAEVVPLVSPQDFRSWGILRARGGSSGITGEIHTTPAYSPRTRR